MIIFPLFLSSPPQQNIKGLGDCSWRLKTHSFPPYQRKAQESIVSQQNCINPLTKETIPIFSNYSIQWKWRNSPESLSMSAASSNSQIRKTIE